MKQMIKFAVVAVIVTMAAGCDERRSATPSSEPSVPTVPVAVQENSAALFKQGLDYRNGSNGVSRDPAKAFGLFSKAAELGDRDAMFFVGLMYKNGESVPVDDQKALAWLTKSADAGNGSAPVFVKELKEKMDGEKK